MGGSERDLQENDNFGMRRGWFPVMNIIQSQDMKC